MTLGIMQPYVFPYIGYYQYVAACDRFVLYDDVQFIMRGWINRNHILHQGRRHLLTVPLVKASPNKRICDVLIANDSAWADKTLKTIEQAYKHAPAYGEVFTHVDEVFSSGVSKISKLAGSSVISISALLGLDAEIIYASGRYDNEQLGRVDRIVDICVLEGADRCIVPIGGSHLYDKGVFREAGLHLDYIKPVMTPYRQWQEGVFEPSLSIIDVLMFNGFGRTAELAKENELL